FVVLLLCIHPLVCFNSTSLSSLFFFFFNAPPTTEIYTLSLPTLFRSRVGEIVGGDVDRLHRRDGPLFGGRDPLLQLAHQKGVRQDRKSTRLNSSHVAISYAVFCLKKKKKKIVTLYPERSATLKLSIHS